MFNGYLLQRDSRLPSRPGEALHLAWRQRERLAMEPRPVPVHLHRYARGLRMVSLGQANQLLEGVAQWQRS